MDLIKPRYIVDKNNIAYIRKTITKEELYGRDECGDCGSKVGELHYLYCDIERCPKCGNQLLSCDCWVSFIM